MKEKKSERIEYGLQLYSLRDMTGQSMQKALEETARLGYSFVEFAGFFGHPAEEIRSWLDEYGLYCSGTHTGLEALSPENIGATAEYHKIIGAKNLILPGADWSTEEKLNENIDSMNRAQKILEQNGIRLGYHNHSHEFFVTPYGRIIEDEVIQRTTVDLEIDTFWAFNAGKDPVEMLEQQKDRIRIIHLKDGIPTAKENRNYSQWLEGVAGRSVGEGKMPVSKVVKWSLEHDVRMVIESEGLNPTGLEEVGRCIAYLRTLE